MPKCFQNIFNSYWSDHLTRDRGSANVSKGKVSSFKWNWLVLHARHTGNLDVTFLTYFFVLNFLFLRVRKSLLVYFKWNWLLVLHAPNTGSLLVTWYCYYYFFLRVRKSLPVQIELAGGAARSSYWQPRCDFFNRFFIFTCDEKFARSNETGCWCCTLVTLAAWLWLFF